jgi:hypothetical protein
MNGAHLHLIVNHVSLFALVIGTVALGVSMKRKSPELRVLASVLFVIAGVFAWIADQSGESAAHLLKTLNNVEHDPFIHQHAEAAEWALRSGTLVALLALAMEWAKCKKPKWFKPLQWTLLIFAIHGCTVFGTTAYLGGLVRHPEIRGNS